MSYNAKNYTEQGGGVTHIGGKLVIEEGATVEGLPCDYELPAATASKLGGIKVGSGLSVTAAGVLSADGITPAAAVGTLENNAQLADVVTAFNALITALKAAGLMADNT